ncbi:subclass B3 metallo-beta-lactamase [Chitinophaga sp. 22321]|uniref:Subclass B3 metallo-beta-lactamase n=1 Tax=Chitinophaga hostae TaxID=2831022 RepID=A0ABS5J6J0_9BACT|nr:subclass B3 metallo-beta-lactamase [Chitinophaga hostae]MBS0030673.1 subclass B3 metallo-beta-lactamase [Chitinophaga hostae]
MRQRILKKLMPVVLCCCLGHYAQAQKVAEPTNHSEEWTRAYAPFRIVGNLYYVGTYDLASYLVTTTSGHILVNTGLASSAAVIKKNVETLGFRFGDIKILLTNQVHYDHVGAMEAVREMTGARFMVDAADESVIKSGGKTDYEMGSGVSFFRPVKISRLLHDKDVISLGDTKLLVLHHPGHTKGSCSFLMDVKDSSRTYKVLLANIPTIITEKKFPKVTTYPQIAADYKYTLDTMPKIQFDIWVAAHASQFDLHTMRKENTPYNPGLFTNREAYEKILKEIRKEYDEKVR